MSTADDERLAQIKLEKYAFIRAIGKGTFGTAWIVVRKSDGEQFVAKVVQLEFMNPRDRKNADTEVRVLKDLKHPNIVAYVDSFIIQNHLYLIQEFANGGDLLSAINKVAKTGPFKEDKVKHIFVQILLGLQYLHKRKIVHRDIKSENIFLMADGTVKLGDFGLCRVLRDTSLAQTVCGTPNYFAPELCNNQPYEYKADIWALGCVMYEFMNFSRLFTGPDARSVCHAIKTWDGRVELNKFYSIELRSMVKRCLAREPENRYDTFILLSQPILSEVALGLNVSTLRPTALPWIPQKQQQQQPPLPLSPPKEPLPIVKPQTPEEVVEQVAALRKHLGLHAEPKAAMLLTDYCQESGICRQGGEEGDEYTCGDDHWALQDDPVRPAVTVSEELLPAFQAQLKFIRDIEEKKGEIHA